jgi:DNA gyrase/topoisomerase IV subunit A
MVPNYNDERTEPVFLPAQTCNLLINGVTGIAVGTTTDIPAFTEDSVNALIYRCLSQKRRVTS